MKYYLVAGEASGDLHASHLMTALAEADNEAQFRFVGGDCMAAVGGECVRHYRDLAYMGFVPVVLHLPTILRAMRLVRNDVKQWQPDALILVDYPGFNLQLARYIHTHTEIPTFYYIAPKIWAWKEWRIKDIKSSVDHLLSILPFEKDFFENKHHYPIHYVGNPTLDEVSDFLAHDDNHDWGDKPIIALLAGSRKQEIRDNLGIMLDAVRPFRDTHQIILAAAPGIDDEFYSAYDVPTVRNSTYSLLRHADAALVTSGTATLETALLGTPQVVCYKIPRLYGWLRPYILKIPYVSLVNLIAGRKVVPELLSDMNAANARHHLEAILPGGTARQAQLDGYVEVAERLGQPGAPKHAASVIAECIKNNKTFGCLDKKL